MKKRYVIILAAGQGTRMKSKLFKVMHPVMGRPMVGHVVQAALDAEVDQVFTVTGVGAEVVKEYLQDKSEYVYQEDQLGTAHAVEQARALLEDKDGTTLVLSGDTPLLQADTIRKLMDFHEEQQAKATVLTAMADDPFGYGRVIRTADGSVDKIVEEKDATDEERAVQEINTGNYCFDNRTLFAELKNVDNDNAQNEYYLPDVVGILKNHDEVIGAYALDNMDESLGVNDRVALSEAQAIMQARINKAHMVNGVTLIDPENTYIDVDVKIGQDTVIEPGTYLKGKTVIGEDVFIGSNSEISNSRIEDKVKIVQSIIEDSTVKEASDIGPFSHLRPDSIIGENVHIGNFVEVKNSTIHSKTLVGHQSYIGDAVIGQHANIGAGVVFANYNGKTKGKTIVGDHSFVGSNATLVAPVVLGEKSFVAASSNITDDIPDEGLGIARSRQVVKEDFYKKHFNK